MGGARLLAEPATLLNGEVLGYLDPLVMLPAVGAVLLAGLGWPRSRGRARRGAPHQAAGAAGGPGLRAARVAPQRVGGLARGGTVGSATVGLLALPHLAAGAGPNMWLAFGSWSARRDILSGYAANLWWIVTWAVRAQYSTAAFGFPGHSWSRQAHPPDLPVPRGRLPRSAAIGRASSPHPRMDVLDGEADACGPRARRALGLHNPGVLLPVGQRARAPHDAGRPLLASPVPCTGPSGRSSGR